MKLITTHVGADFDSLASMVAARKLYREGTLCFSGAASRNVRDFLKRHGSRLTVQTPRKIPLEAISTLIVVDVRSLSRIGPFAEVALRPRVQVHLFDHHPPVSDEIPADYARVETVGATTTLLVELLLERHVPITPFEATLFTLGIYEDTGALTFGATGEREYAAVARLRAQGADLAAVPTWIELAFTLLERELMDRMMEAAYERFLAGSRVVFCALEFPHYVEGISLFAHRLRDAFDADVVVAVVSMDRRTYVTVRGREGVLDARSLLARFSGGGHPQAAAVALPRRDPRELLAELERDLESLLPPVVEVGRIMSSPVMAVSPDQTVEEAYRLMIRYGHAALPVVQEGRLGGLITRKDLDKAQLHGLGAVPVLEFMTERVLTVASRAPVGEAHRLMVAANIGRLPVVDQDTLVGIVTRTDLLRALYPISLPPGERALAPGLPWMEDRSELLSARVDPALVDRLRLLGRRAQDLGAMLYAVGGFVRDLLLGRPNLDVDLVVEGDALGFLESFRGSEVRVSVHRRYRTGTLVFPEGQKIDVATARREFYEYPVAQPTVSSDSLKHDLYRRDFAVNAMALSLNPSTWGELVDYFGGRVDLERGLLRVLHNLSFVEDPTRVLRGVRLERRLGFRMGEDTEKLARNCVRGGLLSLLSGPRLRSELELVLLEEEAPSMAVRLRDLGVLDSVFPGVRVGERTTRTLRRLTIFRKRLRRDLPDPGTDLWLAFLGALLTEGSDWAARSALDRLSLSARERRWAEQGLEGLGAAESVLGTRADPPASALYRFLRDAPVPVALLWGATTEQWRVRRRILLYLTRLSRVEPMLTGRDLLDLGVPRGPRVGATLAELRLARLDGEVETLEEERAWVLRRLGEP